MCGIAGIVSKAASTIALQQKVADATKTLAHRGPNDEQYWYDSNIAFGHKRLCIIDPHKRSSQPLHYLDRYIIIHNGEIYNYLEIKKELQKKGFSFSTESDTEVIAAAYHAYKNECVSYFDGMFAFAIWDKQEQTLFAARDRFGEKPFYFFYDDEQFFFASEIKAIWAMGVEKEVNPRMLYNYLTVGYTSNPFDPQETFYQNISKLPATSFISYSLQTHTISLEKYWTPYIAINKEIDEKEAVEQFISLLSDSVNKRLRSDVSIGTSLSGGLDSSSIVALCAQMSAQQYSHKCFTAVFEGFEKNEKEKAALVAKAFGLQLFPVSINADDLLSTMDNLMWHQEEPIGSASVLAQYKLYEAAKENGVTVLLDGQGADELLAGYNKYYKWYWQELYAARQLGKSKELQNARALGNTEDFGWRNKLTALFPHFAMAMLQSKKTKKAAQQTDLNREFVSHNKRFFYYATPTEAGLNSALYFNSFVYGLEELLRYADRNSMAHGIEVRLPFLHHQLAEFLFTLPANFKIRDGWSKWILRQSMKDVLPKEIVWQKDKIGFEPPQKQWMSNKLVQERIQDSKRMLVQKGILSSQILQKAVRPVAAHAANNSDWKYWSAAYLFR